MQAKAPSGSRSDLEFLTKGICCLSSRGTEREKRFFRWFLSKIIWFSWSLIKHKITLSIGSKTSSSHHERILSLIPCQEDSVSGRWLAKTADYVQCLSMWKEVMGRNRSAIVRTEVFPPATRSRDGVAGSGKEAEPSDQLRYHLTNTQLRADGHLPQSLHRLSVSFLDFF